MFFLLGGGYDVKLHQTLHILGLDDLVDDPRYANNATMKQNADELYDRMSEAFAQKTAAESGHRFWNPWIFLLRCWLETGRSVKILRFGQTVA